ncbi:MAG: cell division protein FtsQ/DivIB [Pseudomonadota bacterium]
MAKRKNKWKRTLRTAGACVLVACVALTPYIVKRQKFRLPLRVRQLRISGITHFPSLDLKDLVDLKQGDPLFGNWTKTTQEKIRRNPKLEGGTIARTLTGEVFMVVTQRNVAALVNLERLYYVDEKGNVLGPALKTEGPAPDLPVLTGPWSGRKNWQGLRERVQEAMDLKRTFVRAGADEKKISELHFDPAQGWAAYLVGTPARIVVGHGDFSTKASRWNRVMQDFRGKEKSIREMDLDFDDRVVVKLEG